MSVRIVQLGSRRLPGEGLRVGTVRHPPRGVRKEELARRDYYDVWFPNLAPSAEAVAAVRADPGPAAWQRFVRRYRSEMGRPEPGRTLDLLAALSHTAEFSVGCYCEDERRCHRSILRLLLEERGATLA
ncbi:MAG TPA: DUF488 family protein [Myxococcaceae bacterium]|nr:DUF488 family protein [Myxococcaceae bacterium]